MSIPIIIQARTGSKRLPRKVLAELAGSTVLGHVIDRCRQAKNVGEVLLATTVEPGDDAVAELAASLGIPVYRGSESDVLLRYIEAARTIDADVLIRITADCPLVDPRVIDRVADMYLESPADYVFIENYPDGLGAAELMTLSALETTLAETEPEDTYYREHVMTYILERPGRFVHNIVQAPERWRKPEIHLSVDDADHLENARRIAEHFAPRTDFSLEEVVEFLESRPDLYARATGAEPVA